MQRNRSISDDIMSTIPSKEGMSAAEWLAEQIPGGFFIYRADDTMELLYVNQSPCDIYGCETVNEFRKMTGNSFRGMVHPEDYEKIQNSIDEQISLPSNRRQIDYVVYRIIRKDGSIRLVDDYGHFATLPGYGEVYYDFIEDITENKLAEEEKFFACGYLVNTVLVGLQRLAYCRHQPQNSHEEHGPERVILFHPFLFLCVKIGYKIMCCSLY